MKPGKLSCSSIMSKPAKQLQSKCPGKAFLKRAIHSHMQRPIIDLRLAPHLASRSLSARSLHRVVALVALAEAPLAAAPSTLRLHNEQERTQPPSWRGTRAGDML